MPGSSVFRKIIKTQVYSATGPIGPTGPTGPTGSTGYGSTGNTGVGISFIGLTNGYLYTQLTNGSTFVSNNKLQGPVGSSITPVKIEAVGDGASIISSAPAQNAIEFRSIKGVTSTTGKSYVKVSPSTNVPSSLLIEYVSRSDGFTLTNYGVDVVSSFVGTTDSGISFTNIRDSNYREGSGSSVFTVANVFEKTRGLGYTGATNYYMSPSVNCNYVYSDLIDNQACKTVKIDPSCKSDNPVDLLTTNKIYFIDMQNNFGKVIIGAPISPMLSTSFTLIVKNAKNTELGVQKRFSSTSTINWPFNIEPCFGGNGNVDAYHFYSLYGSWYGSVVYSTRYAGKTFDCVRGTPGPIALGACCELDTTLPEGQCGITCSLKLASQCVGVNKVFRGIGSTCGTNTCGFTGTCCLTISCDPNVPEQPADGCYEGITFANCLCKDFCNELGDECGTPSANTIPDDASTVFHYGVTCGEINNCQGSSCPTYGACCQDGVCTPGQTEEQCTGANKTWFPGQNCSNSNLCVMGRCCSIDFNNLSQSTCQNTYRNDCIPILNASYGVTWTAGLNCETNKCFDYGSCCTGGDCIYPTNRLNFPISNWIQYIQGAAVLGNANAICTQGLCGNFRGPVSCSDGSVPACTDPVVDAQTGLCVIFRRDDYPIIISESTKVYCSTFLNSKFYPGFTLGVTGSCCSRVDYGGFYGEYNCVNTDHVTNTFTTCMNRVTFPNEQDGSFIEAGYTLQPCPSSAQSCETRIPDTGITFTSLPDTIFVGYYYPKGGNLKGKNFKTCCPPTYQDLMEGGLTSATQFDSRYDWHGYGMTFAANSDTRASNIRFKVFLNVKDLGYTLSGQKQTDVIWGQTGGYSTNAFRGRAWGPRVTWDGTAWGCSDLQFQIQYYSYFDEGYWQNLNTSNEPLISPTDLVNYTYNKPSNLNSTQSWLSFIITDMNTVNNQSLSNNGKWRRNFGLYNTMRMYGADNAFVRAQNLSGCPSAGGFVFNEFEISNEWTAARLTAKLNRENPVPSNSSSWFIPSMDEMAFLCENLSTINNVINQIGGDKILGNYWTSTAGFSYTGLSGQRHDEGVKTPTDASSIPTRGSVAWVYNVIEQAIGSYDITTQKAKRDNKYKVRAIRLEPETVEEVPSPTSEEYKVWRLTRLKWVDDKLASGG